MSSLLTPIMYIATGLGFALFLVVNLMAGRYVRSWPGRWFGIGMLVAPVGFLLIARSGLAGTSNEAAQLLLGAGAAFFVSIIAVGVGIVATARRQGAQAGSQGVSP